MEKNTLGKRIKEARLSKKMTHRERLSNAVGKDP